MLTQGEGIQEHGVPALVAANSGPVAHLLRVREDSGERDGSTGEPVNRRGAAVAGGAVSGPGGERDECVRQRAGDVHHEEPAAPAQSNAVDRGWKRGGLVRPRLRHR